MSNEFCLGLYFGVIAGALPVLVRFCWHLDQNVKDHLRDELERTLSGRGGG